jgi:hypothetical protein
MIIGITYDRVQDRASMNSVERQQIWQQRISEHAESDCVMCEGFERGSNVTCEVWKDLVSAYNSAREV